MIEVLPGIPIARPTAWQRVLQSLGHFSDRNMVWSWAEPINFGDWIGPLIYAAKTGDAPLFSDPARQYRGRSIYAVGSILKQIEHPDTAIVWGSGIMFRNDNFARPLEIRAVRGPLTRDRCIELGYDCPTVYGDPALLLPDYLPRPDVPQSFDVGIVPHFVNLEEVQATYGKNKDVKIIDVRRPIWDVLDDIVACRTIVSSSLHGLIVSHAYGVPAAWVRFQKPVKGDGVKFADYYAAGNVPQTPAAEMLTGARTTSALSALAFAAPMPDNARLSAPLREVCPF